MRERFKIFSLLFLLLSLNFAQINPGARQISIANSDVALSNDVFSIYSNPSGVAQMNWREIGLFYSPAPFGLKELANGFIGYIEPMELFNLSLGAMTYGFDLYKENKISIDLAKNFSNNLFVGLMTNLNFLSIKNYGSDLSVSFDLGLLTYLTDEIRFGFSYKNFTLSTYGESKNQIPTVFSAGISYSLLENSNINFAVEKDLDLPVSLRMGVEYLLLEYIAVRAGFSSAPEKFTFGLGIIYSFLEVDYAIFNHQDLGLTHQVGILLSFSEDKSRQTKIKEYLELK